MFTLVILRDYSHSVVTVCTDREAAEARFDKLCKNPEVIAVFFYGLTDGLINYFWRPQQEGKTTASPQPWLDEGVVDNPVS